MSDDEILVQRRLRHLWDKPASGGRSMDDGRRGRAVVDDADHGPAVGGADHGPAVGGAGSSSPDATPDGFVIGPPAAATTDRSAAGPLGLTAPGVFDPGRRGIRALAAVAAVVVVVAAGWAWWSRPRVEPAPAPVPGADVATAVAAATPTAGTEVVVAVAGRVRRPGLVRLPAGARVADALNAAGGVLPGTDPALLNLARRVTDGELIVVGVTPPPGLPLPAASAGALGGTAPGAKINLNTATMAELDSLPGVGPVLAQRIIDHRDRHGGFRSVGELRQVDGIGDARYEQLKELVVV